MTKHSCILLINFLSHSKLKKNKLHSLSCVFATTKTYYNQKSTRRSGEQPTCYFIALRTVPFLLPNCSALHCGLLSRQDHIWFSYIPELKNSKNWCVWFLANHREMKVPSSSISLENILSKISLWQQQYCSFHSFLLRKAVSCSRILHYQKVMGYSAHSGCNYIAVRSLTEVAWVRVPQPEPLCIHLVHSQATLAQWVVAHWQDAF